MVLTLSKTCGFDERYNTQRRGPRQYNSQALTLFFQVPCTLPAMTWTFWKTFSANTIMLSD
jgi:hypothetical protein